MCKNMEATRSDFSKVIYGQYKDRCKLQEIEPTIEGLVVYLINRNLITDLTINRFLIIDKYPLALAQNAGVKQLACWQLEDEVGLKFASIKLIIKRFSTYFRHKQRVVPKN